MNFVIKELEIIYDKYIKTFKEDFNREHRILWLTFSVANAKLYVFPSYLSMQDFSNLLDGFITKGVIVNLNKKVLNYVQVDSYLKKTEDNRALFVSVKIAGDFYHEQTLLGLPTRSQFVPYMKKFLEQYYVLNQEELDLFNQWKS